MKRPAWHSHPTVRSGDDLTLGERTADAAVRVMGSWTFLICQSVFIAGWIGLNVVGAVAHWDPMPFILLNLAFSTQAAYAAPLILLGQRRQDSKAREMAEADLGADQASLALLRKIAAHLNIDTAV